jgi:hypothetical protein
MMTSWVKGGSIVTWFKGGGGRIVMALLPSWVQVCKVTMLLAPSRFAGGSSLVVEVAMVVVEVARGDDCQSSRNWLQRALC